MRKLVLLALCVALVLGVGGVASADDLLSFEAEDMSFGSYASVVSDSGSSGGAYLRFSQPGIATESVTLETPADAVVVKAKSRKIPNGIGGELEVYVNGQKLHEGRVNSLSYVEVEVPAQLGAGSHEIGVGGEWLGNNRDLFVDTVRLTGDAAPPADTDGDGVPDAEDNCPGEANAGQIDEDGDGIGNACDPQDNRDSDGDGVQNHADRCEGHPDSADLDGDGTPDGCDSDRDGDGSPNDTDYAPDDPAIQDPPPPSGGDCDTPLQQQINNASAGDTVNIAGCVFRESAVVNKALTVDGGGTAVIKGSDVWGGWSSSGEDFVSDRSVPNLPLPTDANCSEPTCNWPEQVFVDGAPLQQVGSGSDPGPDEFKINSSRNIIMGANPAGKTVEVTVRPYWIRAGADNVTIRGIKMLHAGNEPQTGAVANEEYNGFTLDDFEAGWAHGANVSIKSDYSAQGAIVSDGRIHHGGQLGIHQSRGKVTVDNVEVDHNHTEGYNVGWEAGGSKFAGILRGGSYHEVNILNSEAHHNNGQGFWTDVDARNVTMAYNRVHHNARSGIGLELTNGANIHHNVAYENGYIKSGWGWGGQIKSSSSKNLHIHDNVVAWGPDGITIQSQDRWQADYANVSGVVVEDNDILASEYDSSSFALGWLQDHSGTLFSNTSNFGQNNRYYWDHGTQRYGWNGTHNSLLAFNATRGEENGRMLSESEKDALVSQNELPAAPER